MTKLYTFVRDELSKSKGNIIDFKSNIIIFVPSVSKFEKNDVVPGTFMLPEILYWHDPTGCMEKIREIAGSHSPGSETEFQEFPPLSVLYPGFYDFFVVDCGAPEAPSFRAYLKILRRLSNAALPSEVAHEVFQVFLKWADDFKLELLGSNEVNELKDYLSKSENTVLPTVQDTWVSLNPTFGVIYWTDEEKSIEQYKDFDDVHFLQFGELTAKEREMLRGKVSIFLENIGIRALTDVVFRKAIPYGIANEDYKTSLVNWILPYAQRYLHKMHPDLYFNLKVFEYVNTLKLQVVVVEKLYYKNSIRGRDGPSRKRFACSCLLEENIFYTTQDTDSHALFLELSRFFFHGTPNLHMANFLHIITSKAELGHTEEQIEPFIVDSLKVPPLPKEESLWVLDFSSDLNLEPSLHSRTKHRYTNLPINTISKLSWPPVNWKNSSGLSSTSDSTLHSDGHENVVKKPAEAINLEDGPVPSPADKSSRTDTDFPSKSHETVFRKLPKAINLEDVAVPSMEDEVFTENEILCLKTVENDRSYEAGRQGEMIAYRYFTEKLGEAAVKWLNRDFEMGLPYDLIIEQDSKKVYVEVKSTVSATKNWFHLSTNEWHCAVEKEESFMIARVVLSSAENAKVLIFKNPAKLCRENMLQLALIQPLESENLAS
ncbi:hypothetical protein KSP39_PZI024219 [Platanthera zijinensis]|uniref:Protein NO VEIN C-terminal domain-containing protein n=1 Tax=Platanthera zijinensis TaxID=2320716 RepID=A0AAP0FTH6_9ASPA